MYRLIANGIRFRRKKKMSLKSSNKVDTNLYALEVEISAEQLKDAKMKAYQKQKKN